MPAIDEMQYGYDGAGLDVFLESIHTESLKQAEEVVQDIKPINTVLDAEWEGEAKENFKENLVKDSVHVVEQFEALFVILKEEVQQALAAMQEKDHTMITVE